jgi:hypothetical protein
MGTSGLSISCTCGTWRTAHRRREKYYDELGGEQCARVLRFKKRQQYDKHRKNRSGEEEGQGGGVDTSSLGTTGQTALAGSLSGVGSENVCTQLPFGESLLPKKAPAAGSTLATSQSNSGASTTSGISTITASSDETGLCARSSG